MDINCFSGKLEREEYPYDQNLFCFAEKYYTAGIWKMQKRMLHGNIPGRCADGLS